jgi:hypothetical protein
MKRPSSPTPRGPDNIHPAYAIIPHSFVLTQAAAMEREDQTHTTAGMGPDGRANRYERFCA